MLPSLISAVVGYRINDGYNKNLARMQYEAFLLCFIIVCDEIVCVLQFLFVRAVVISYMAFDLSCLFFIFSSSYGASGRPCLRIVAFTGYFHL